MIHRRPDRLAVNASWLLRLRWVAVAGQLLTVGFVTLGLQVPVPLVPLLAVIAFTAVSNVVFAAWLRGQSRRGFPSSDSGFGQRLLAALITVDLVSLTILLYFTGGPTNPFLVFYFVNLALATVIVTSRWSWLLAAVALLGVLVIWFWHVPLPDLPLATQRIGMLVAVVTCAVVVVYFITRVTGELQERENDLRVAEQRRARSERLEALATLAAGAGHELASPLSTIAVVAKELSKHLEGANVPPSVLEDVSLIRSELDHCRAILDRMAVTAGQAVGEELSPVPVVELVSVVLDGLRRRQQVTLALDERTGARELLVPVEAVAQALRNLLQNALDASRPGESVEWHIASDDDWLVLTVRDRGVGMSSDILARAGEPFFTTKQPGEGMGMGLFLTRTVIERLGGTLDLQSTPHVGTTAIVRLRS